MIVLDLLFFERGWMGSYPYHIYIDKDIDIDIDTEYGVIEIAI